MIPRIVHQTWRDATLPERFREMAQSWRDRNPGWEYRLWTDADLDRLVDEHYPALRDIYRAYPNPVQRADVGRYLALHRHGGVYADIDTTCLDSFDCLTGEDRPVFAVEPSEHAAVHASYRRLPYLLCNAVMASPKGHPFWETVIDALVQCRHAKDVLESTGPILLTGCLQAWPDRDGVALNSCHVFAPLASSGLASGDIEFGPYASRRLSVHHWAGTWYNPPRTSPWRRIKGYLRRKRHEMTRGAFLDPAQAIARLDAAELEKARAPGVPADEARIAIFVPIRDAARHVENCLGLIGALDFPKDRIKLAFCEGDSIDGTAEVLKSALDRIAPAYRDVRLLRFSTGTTFGGLPRWHKSLQRYRRAGIARVRNRLIAEALDADDDWVLWIDADVCAYPPDVLTRLLNASAPIAAPDCVLEPGGRSFDMNNFLDVGTVRDSAYYKHVHDGLFQPPADYFGRRHLHDLRYVDRIALTGVGGTMLLVNAAVHRAGLVFPEIPYRDLIETEAFGQMACDCGLTPIGLPNLEIRHVRE